MSVDVTQEPSAHATMPASDLVKLVATVAGIVKGYKDGLRQSLSTAAEQRLSVHFDHPHLTAGLIRLDVVIVITAELDASGERDRTRFTTTVVCPGRPGLFVSRRTDLLEAVKKTYGHDEMEVDVTAEGTLRFV